LNFGGGKGGTKNRFAYLPQRRPGKRKNDNWELVYLRPEGQILKGGFVGGADLPFLLVPEDEQPADKTKGQRRLKRKWLSI